jgi:hypothetical protein
MNDNTKWIALVSVICTAVSAILAVFAYLRQQKINRIQNLTTVFQRFSNNDDFLSIFNICDASYVQLNKPTAETELNGYSDQLKSTSAEKKLKYLAFLEEIAILAKNSAVISKNAIHLFKFHFYFYYVYGNHKISQAFWDNIGSGADEKNKEGWDHQSDFAKKCAQSI